jgi:hypothetical protein
MSDEATPADPSPAKRGDAAWKEMKARISDRNDKVRKAGKESREAYTREKEGRRHRADRIERDAVVAADEKRRKA